MKIKRFLPDRPTLSNPEKVFFKLFFDVGGLMVFLLVSYRFANKLTEPSFVWVVAGVIIFLLGIGICLGGGWKWSTLGHGLIFGGFGILAGWHIAQGNASSFFEAGVILLISLSVLYFVVYALALFGVETPIWAMAALAYVPGIITLIYNPYIIPELGMKYSGIDGISILTLGFLLARLIWEMKVCLQNPITIDGMELLSISHFLTSLLNFVYRGRAQLRIDKTDKSKMSGWQKFVLGFSENLITIRMNAFLNGQSVSVKDQVGQALLVYIPERYSDIVQRRLKIDTQVDQQVTFEEIQEILDEIRRRKTQEDQ